ncbi:MAG: hypothetical protein QM820_33365 [Minicystis sp.]
MRRAAALLIASLLASSCASTPPEGAPVSPAPAVSTPSLRPTSSAAAPPADEPCPPDPPEPDRAARNRGFSHTVPDKPLTVGRITCKAGDGVWRDAEGRVRACTIGPRTTLDGVDIAAGAYTLFHDNGRAEQTHIAHAMSLRTGAGVAIPCGVDLVVLSPSGALEGCKLDKPMTFDGVACRAGESVHFHPSGKLLAAVIDGPMKALSTTFPAGTGMSWHENGTIARAWLAEPLLIEGYLVRYEIEAHPNGRLAMIELEEPRTIAGHEFPERSKNLVSPRRDDPARRVPIATRLHAARRAVARHALPPLRLQGEARRLGHGSLASTLGSAAPALIIRARPAREGSPESPAH